MALRVAVVTPRERADNFLFRHGHNPNWGLEESIKQLAAQIEEACAEIKIETAERLIREVAIGQTKSYAEGFRAARDKASRIARNHECPRRPDICGMEISDRIAELKAGK